jgi:hypothetical protein
MARRQRPDDERLRELAAIPGITLNAMADRIAEIPGFSRPQRQTVARWLKDLGITHGYGKGTDLIPWTVATEHHDSRWRRILQAEAKCRESGPRSLSGPEERMVGQLRKVHAMGLVVCYDRARGFYLADRTPEDDDVVRRRH